MILTRRRLLASAAALGVSAAFARPVWADDATDSIWDMMEHNALMKAATPDKNTALALGAIDTPEPILSFDTANNIQNAIAYYAQVVQQGGWDQPTRPMFRLSLGKSGLAVAHLQRHLMITGDMPATTKTSQDFDNATDLGIRRFQVRHGIIPTGKVDEPTFYALQVTAEQRLSQLQLNLLRVQTVATNLKSDRYVLVNIPAASIEAGSGPYFYLPKLESMEEAALWSDVFAFAEQKLGLARGRIKATVLIETITAAFEMDEILHALKENIVGLNCGRWDYIFSYIKRLGRTPERLTPDRAAMTMDKAFLAAYSLKLIETCHRRGAFAMGGMAAQIPVKGDEAANEAAFDKVRADKRREAANGPRWAFAHRLSREYKDMFISNYEGLSGFSACR